MLVWVAFLLLLGPLVAALQFGGLFRNNSLGYLVDSYTSSEIAIDGAVYHSKLYLESASLSVSMDGMQACIVPKNGKEIRYIKEEEENTNVESGDKVIIFKTGSIIETEKYRDASADTLKSMIENDGCKSIVFGVVIQEEPVLEKEIAKPEPKAVAQPAPTFGFVNTFLKEWDNTRVESFQSTMRMVVDDKHILKVSIEAGDKLFVHPASRAMGIALIRGDQIVDWTPFDMAYKEVSFKKGDRFILAVAAKREYVDLQMQDMASKLNKAGIDALKTEAYSNLTVCSAEIDHVVNHLKDIAVFGKGSVTNGNFRHLSFNVYWSFKAGTMTVRNDDSLTFHIMKNGNVDTGGIYNLFSKRNVVLSDLQPGDIVVIITCTSGKAHFKDFSKITKKFTGCKNSIELQAALENVIHGDITGGMAAIISDNIQASQ